MRYRAMHSETHHHYVREGARPFELKYTYCGQPQKLDVTDIRISADFDLRYELQFYFGRHAEFPVPIFTELYVYANRDAFMEGDRQKALKIVFPILRILGFNRGEARICVILRHKGLKTT